MSVRAAGWDILIKKGVNAEVFTHKKVAGSGSDLVRVGETEM